MEKMNQQMRSVLLFCVLAFLCQSCESLGHVDLFAGRPVESMLERLEVHDGQGQEARFVEIQQLEEDSSGNIYVYDYGVRDATEDLDYHTAATIRKVSPEGKVTTLIGAGVGRNLIGFTNIVIREDVLYAISAGCLLKANLQSEPLLFRAIYGECLSIQDLKSKKFAAKENSIIIRGQLESIALDGTLYFSVFMLPGEQGKHLILPVNEKVEITSDIGYEPFSVQPPWDFDSAGRSYSIERGPAGPGPESPNLLLQIPDLETIRTKGFDSTVLYQNLLKNPGSVMLDEKDYLYIRDDGFYKQISPQGRIRNLARLDFSELSIHPGADVVTPNQDRLYFATDTALYKIALPPLNS